MQGGGVTQGGSEPLLRTYFDAGKLPLGYHYIDYSEYDVGTATNATMGR